MTSVEQPPASAVTQVAAGKPAADLDQKRDAVRGELSRVVGRANGSVQRARRRSRAWSSLYFLVGLPAAVCTAVAGALALASPAYHIAVGITALGAAGLTAAAAFFDSATRQTAADNLAAGWQVLSNDARLALVFDLGNDDWLVRESRDLLQDLANRERKLSEGKAPDAEAEAERRAQIETIRAQTEATRAQAEAERADAEAERARAAELTSQDYKTRGRVLAAAIEARASGVARAEANEAAAPTKENED